MTEHQESQQANVRRKRPEIQIFSWPKSQVLAFSPSKVGRKDFVDVDVVSLSAAMNLFAKVRCKNRFFGR